MQYKDPSSIGKIKELTNNSIHFGLDAISETEAQKFSVQTFGTGGGKLITILGVYEESQKLRPDVTIIRTSFALRYSLNCFTYAVHL